MVDRIVGMYFSPTGTTEKIVQELVEILAMQLKCKKEYVDFTSPKVRENVHSFKEGDLVVFGTPVYAGRVPNLMLNFIRSVQGCGAMAIPIVLFGNRNYDDALAELQALLAEDGFIPVAAGAFVGEHSFSEILGAGRPDNADMEVVEAFAEDIYNKLTSGFKPVPGMLLNVGGEYPSKGYYQPRDRKGVFIDIRKVKPKTSDACIECKLCANTCPMGAINPENVKEVPGICIKCGSCSKKCPMGAKYYDDEGYLYHQHELEDEYTRRAEPSIFV